MLDGKGLVRAALGRFGVGLVLIGGLLFLCAGSVRYWQGWLFLGTFAVCLLCFGVYLFRTDKELLQKRLKGREKERQQQAYVWLAALALPAVFALGGLDFRFGWSHLPVAAVLAALVVMLLGYALFVVTLMQNRFASRTVEIQQAQRVIDTGVYGVVRHPMYTAALLMFAAVPLVLGSPYALLPVLLFAVGIVLRIRNEEQVLSRGLPGYAAYRQKVRWRIVPYLW